MKNTQSVLSASTAAVLFLSVVFAAPTANAQRQFAVRGVVLDSLGGSVSAAHVSIAGTATVAVTDAAGTFRFARVPEGTVIVTARRLGYKPASATVTHAAQESVVELRLAGIAELLPAVQVRARGEPSDARLAGYNSRRERGVGHFVTREQLDRLDSPRFVDALRGMPGLVVRPLGGSGGGRTISIRGKCSPLVFLDGLPASAGALDLDMIDLSSVEGIEVFSGLATVPAEFQSVRGGERCGVIAIWSRVTRPRKRRLAPARIGELERELAGESVYSADQVDQPVILATGTATPVYPDSLWRAGAPGRVVAEFIVGVDGTIEDGTFGIASSTHPYFSVAVRSAVDGALFRPAILAGKRVRQVVQLPFVFELGVAPPADGTSPSP